MMRDRVCLLVNDPEDPILVGDAGQERDGKTPTSGIEAAFIARLRKEGNDLKECFNRSSFQTISLCGILIAGVVHFMAQQPIVGLAAIGILPITLSVTRLGIHKFSAASRYFGYELYLGQISHLQKEQWGRWKPSYLHLDWETAMNAWRIVYPALSNRLYRRRRILKRLRVVRREFRPSRKQQVWFVQQSQFFPSSGVRWRGGDYLKSMNWFLHLFAAAAVILLGLTLVLVMVSGGGIHLENGRKAYVIIHEVSFFGTRFSRETLFIAVVFSYAFWKTLMRLIQDNVEREMLEDGLGSIASCAIVWRAVVVAHYSAVQQCLCYPVSLEQIRAALLRLPRREREDALAGNAAMYIDRAMKCGELKASQHEGGSASYPFWLAQEAASLAAHPLEIHQWIFDRCAHQ